MPEGTCPIIFTKIFPGLPCLFGKPFPVIFNTVPGCVPPGIFKFTLAPPGTLILVYVPVINVKTFSLLVVIKSNPFTSNSFVDCMTICTNKSPGGICCISVSYTHLTLPTILLV